MLIGIQAGLWGLLAGSALLVGAVIGYGKLYGFWKWGFDINPGFRADVRSMIYRNLYFC